MATDADHAALPEGYPDGRYCWSAFSADGHCIEADPERLLARLSRARADLTAALREIIEAESRLFAVIEHSFPGAVPSGEGIGDPSMHDIIGALEPILTRAARDRELVAYGERAVARSFPPEAPSV